MGIKDRRTKILLSLILLSNDEFKSIKYDSDICSIFDINLNTITLKTFQELAKEGVIEGEIVDEVPIYKLTNSGFTEISLNFPVFRFTKEKWDGLFRILSYEIPETKRDLRDKLRREVASWGLGPWHRSFWISPHPIIPSLRKLVAAREEEKYIVAFESNFVFGERDLLIEKVWSKSKLESEYRRLFKTWHSTLSQDGSKVEKISSIVKNYVDIIKVDPGLPKQLLGENWIGFEAVKLFREIRDILLTKDSN